MSGMPGTEDDAAYHVDDVMFVGEQDYVMNQFIPDLKQSFEMAEQHLTAVGSSFQFLRRTYVEIEKGLKVMPGKYAESMVEMYKEKMGRVKVQKLPCGQEVLKPDGIVFKQEASPSVAMKKKKPAKTTKAGVLAGKVKTLLPKALDLGSLRRVEDTRGPCLGESQTDSVLQEEEEDGPPEEVTTVVADAEAEAAALLAQAPSKDGERDGRAFRSKAGSSDWVKTRLLVSHCFADRLQERPKAKRKKGGEEPAAKYVWEDPANQELLQLLQQQTEQRRRRASARRRVEKDGVTLLQDGAQKETYSSAAGNAAAASKIASIATSCRPSVGQDLYTSSGMKGTSNRPAWCWVRCYSPGIRFRAGSTVSRSPEELLTELRRVLLTKGEGSIAGVQQLSNEWFALADKDRSKSIGSDEFHALMDTVGLSLQDAESQALFQYFDPKKQGEISYSDFTQTLRGEMPAFAASLAFMDQYRGHYPSNMASLRRVQPRFDPEETDEWLESLEAVLKTHGPTRARFLLHELGDEYAVAPAGFMALGRWISLLSLPATWAAWVSLSDLQGDLSPDPVEKAEASPPSPAPEVLEATEFLQRHSRELEENHVNLSALLSLERLDPNDPNTPKGPTQDRGAESGGRSSGGRGCGVRSGVDQASGGRSRAILAKAFALAKRIRSHEGNLVASVVNVVNPDNCLTKLLYLLYRAFADGLLLQFVGRRIRFEKEDDFPYLPRKLGSCDIGFNFQMGEVTGGFFG
eukprot:g31061.t1